MIGLKEGKGSGTNRTRVVNIREEDYDVYIGRAGRGMDGYFTGNTFTEESMTTRNSKDGWKACKGKRWAAFAGPIRATETSSRSIWTHCRTNKITET